MDATKSSAIAHPSTPDLEHVGPIARRVLRAQALFEERGHEIRRFGAGLYRVPSYSGEGFYTVDYLEERCTCPDHEHRRATCLHIYAVGILNAKRRQAKATPCAGCGEKHPRRELVEVGPEQAAHSLEAREGARYCRPCAHAAGVL